MFSSEDILQIADDVRRGFFFSLMILLCFLLVSSSVRPFLFRDMCEMLIQFVNCSIKTT